LNLEVEQFFLVVESLSDCGLVDLFVFALESSFVGRRSGTRFRDEPSLRNCATSGVLRLYDANVSVSGDDHRDQKK
jgi:hypothetical protein